MIESHPNGSTKKRVVVVGAGGHAKVVLDLLLSEPGIRVLGLTDRDPDKVGTAVLGVPVIGDDEALEAFPRRPSLVLGLGTTSSDPRRRRVYERLRDRGYSFLTLVSPDATVSRWAALGAGTVVLARAVIGPGAGVGEIGLVNSGAVVEHDCHLGRNVHVATGAALAGHVLTGDDVHLGVGVCVKGQVRIGAGVTVGAGSCVVSDLPSNTVCFGNPCRVQKPTPAVERDGE
ncbi:MAG: acetyltransferase [Proteobacteria bacterium]|nr:acetyltransferase [Pseudomonadota bacterium]MBU1741724.1 acetyltransferase [Pseudomonadota bacterium]